MLPRLIGALAAASLVVGGVTAATAHGAPAAAGAAVASPAGQFRAVSRSATPVPAAPVASQAQAPAPAPAPRPAVAPLHGLDAADFLVLPGHAVYPAQLRAARALPGVAAVQLLDYGQLSVAGHPATAIGVDPSSFRAFTPRLTAASDALWARVAAGDLTVSFTMGHDAALPLGQTVGVRGPGATAPAVLRLGAFADTLPGIDAMVSVANARRLGLPTANALVISDAAGADPMAVQQALRATFGDAAVQTLHQIVVIRDAGEFLNRLQLDTVIKAAYSRLGAPYVWGATGPSTFDCSGLVGWAYAQAGISLPRTSEQQWFAGPHVPLADARPGDLLFWTYNPADPTDVDHVALYVGNGLMIAAPHTGERVQLTPVWRADLAGVVRVDPAMAAAVGGPRFLAR